MLSLTIISSKYCLYWRSMRVLSSNVLRKSFSYNDSNDDVNRLHQTVTQLITHLWTAVKVKGRDVTISNHSFLAFTVNNY